MSSYWSLFLIHFDKNIKISYNTHSFTTTRIETYFKALNLLWYLVCVFIYFFQYKLSMTVMFKIAYHGIYFTDNNSLLTTKLTSCVSWSWFILSLTGWNLHLFIEKWIILQCILKPAVKQSILSLWIYSIYLKTLYFI